TVMHHPLIEFIRSALDVILNDWRYESVFRCVKTDFFLPVTMEDSDEDGSLKQIRQAMDRLENYVLAFGIHGYRWKQPEPWNYRIYRSLEDEFEVTDTELAQMQEMNECRSRIVQPLLKFERLLSKALNVQDITTALFQLLTDVRAPERLE